MVKVTDWKTWALGALLTLFVAGGSFFITSLDARVAAAEEKATAAATQAITIDSAVRERLARVEEALKNQSAQLDRIETNTSDVRNLLIEHLKQK